MSLGTTGFPEQRLIWPGAVLGSIAHAIFVGRNPAFSHEQSWDGENYSVQDSAGSRGTIAFSEKAFVGVFFSEASSRNPFRSHSEYRLTDLLGRLPDDLRALAHDEALQYVLEEFRGYTLPIITSVFWGDGRSALVAANEPWSDVVDHGAFLIRNQVLQPDIATARWASDYDLMPREVGLLKAVFTRRMADPHGRIALTSSEDAVLREGCATVEGLEAARESFSEIGIVVR